MVYLVVVVTGINKLRNHLLGTSTQVRACTASSQACLAVRDELLGVQQQQLAAATLLIYYTAIRQTDVKQLKLHYIFLSDISQNPDRMLYIV